MYQEGPAQPFADSKATNCGDQGGCAVESQAYRICHSASPALVGAAVEGSQLQPGAVGGEVAGDVQPHHPGRLEFRAAIAAEGHPPTAALSRSIPAFMNALDKLAEYAEGNDIAIPFESSRVARDPRKNLIPKFRFLLTPRLGGEML